MINQRRLREAMQLHTAGRFDEAWERYQRLLADNKLDGDLLHLMGVLAGQVGNLTESVKLITRAIALRPGIPDFHKNLAITYTRLEDFPAAAAAFVAQGDIFLDAKAYEEAVAAYAQASRLDPQNEHAANNRAAVLNKIGRYEEARDLLLRFLALPPITPEALMPEGEMKQIPAMHLNLANAHHGLGEIEPALAAYERCLSLKPDMVVAHNDYALTLLLAGRLPEGFAEMEWRWKDKSYLKPRGFSQKVWKGETPDELGGRLLVTSEQGYGDTLQFVRYALMLADQGHRVLLEVKPELFTLLSEAIAHERLEVIPLHAGQPGIHDHLDFVAHTGILSLPHRFGTTIETIPSLVPYLHMGNTRRELWRRRFEQDAARLKVGLVWGGNPLYNRNFERSMPPTFLDPLLQRQNVTFYSLQKGPAASWPFPTGNVVTLDPELADFADTADAMANLDLMITTDTAVAHLAGALGIPTWIMLMRVPDWRWGLSGATTPWYPNARLFRQPARGDWPSVIEAVGQALDDKLA